MQIGIVGAPNKGKSRFFSALCAMDVAVADYPFTTIEPNRGVALLRVPCAHVSLGLEKCDARGAHCRDGMREIAVPMLDVAGLVPGAHDGRGMGNKFLDDLRNADGFIQVVDASGRTDLDGNAADDFPLEEEIGFLGEEMEAWLQDVVRRNYPKFRNQGLNEVGEALSGLGYGTRAISEAVEKDGLPLTRILWDDRQIDAFARNLYANGKPRLVAANKADIPGTLERIKKLKNGPAREGRPLEGNGTGRALPPIVPCSAAYEYALGKAALKGLVDYRSGAKTFEVVGKPDEKQGAALEQMRQFVLRNGGTGVPQALHQMVFGLLMQMVVYPVEDENRYSDRQGTVLPDALLVPEGTTAVGLAGMIHTDLARGFVGAVDARTKMRVGRDHALKDGDIVKIVSTR
ncbi:MAG: YchF-related putative GTPase [Candidatus Micrarchaeota archaeon]